MKTLRRAVLTAALALLVLPTASASAQVPPAAPEITEQPHSTETGYYSPDNPGSAAFFSQATADGPLAGQWQVSTDDGVSFADIAGETSAGTDHVYAEYLTEVTPDNDHLRYRIQWTNAVGTTTSVVVFVALNYAIVTDDPQDTTVMAGEAAQFFVTADSGGGGIFTTQWQVSTDGGATFTDIGEGVFSEAGVPVPLEIDPTAIAQDGNLYRATVMEGGIEDTSAAALLTVTPRPPQAPSAPTDLAATQTGPAQVTVTWQAPADAGSDPVTGYTVQFDGETTTYPADAREAVFDLVSPGSYDVSILATNVVGDSPAATTSVTVTLVPTDDTDPDDTEDPDDTDDSDHDGTSDPDSGVSDDNDDRDGSTDSDDDAAVDDSAADRALPAELPATGRGSNLLAAGVMLIAVGVRLTRRTA